MTKRYKNLTESNWITRAFKDKFTVQDGIVRLKNNPSSSSAAPAPPPVAPKAAPKPKLKGAEFWRAFKQTYGDRPVP